MPTGPYGGYGGPVWTPPPIPTFEEFIEQARGPEFWPLELLDPELAELERASRSLPSPPMPPMTKDPRALLQWQIAYGQWRERIAPLHTKYMQLLQRRAAPPVPLVRGNPPLSPAGASGTDWTRFMNPWNQILSLQHSVSTPFAPWR